MLSNLFKITDLLLIFFWNCALLALSGAYYLLIGMGYLISGLWKGVGLLPFIYPAWKKADNFFSLRDSAPALAVRKSSGRLYKSTSLVLKRSAAARFILFIPVVLVAVYILLYLPPFYIAYRHKYQTGTASWYGPGFYFNRTANGELFIPFWGYTAAHNTLPLGTKVLIKNVGNGKKALVWINDRGPFVGNRILDLSKLAAWRLGIYEPGTAIVEIYTLKKF
ncbi:MAG: hypothetical protein A2020_09605 [Lentisphaerae bacterium GWF2_45_14]|nr:MAG: hypothetical protein A2020_09605 [Lentisphaerae bacterium GWF2_45_14]